METSTEPQPTGLKREAAFRRRHDRRSAAVTALVHSHGRFQTVSILDFSTGGLQLQGAFGVAPADRYRDRAAVRPSSASESRMVAGQPDRGSVHAGARADTRPSSPSSARSPDRPAAPPHRARSKAKQRPGDASAGHADPPEAPPTAQLTSAINRPSAMLPASTGQSARSCRGVNPGMSRQHARKLSVFLPRADTIAVAEVWRDACGSGLPQ